MAFGHFVPTTIVREVEIKVMLYHDISAIGCGHRPFVTTLHDGVVLRDRNPEAARNI